MAASNLCESLHNSSIRYPRKIALVFGAKKISYQSLDEYTTRIASGLSGLGIARNESVCILLDNCPEFVISYYAILKAGLCAVPVNYMLTIEEVKHVVENSGAVCLITSRSFLDMAKEIRLRVERLKHIVCVNETREEDVIDFPRIARKATQEPGPISCNPMKPAVILYTSGTTGKPKGAMLSHRNLISNALACSRAIRITRKDTFLCILPLFHSFSATVCMNLPLALGSTIVIMKSLKPFKRVIRSVRMNKVTVFVAIPSVYNLLAGFKLPRILKSPLIKIFNPVRICVSGAAALRTETFKKFERTFRIPLLEGYGLTEASPVVTINPLDKRKPGSVGKSLSDDIELKVIDEHGRTLERDKTGELLVKGPNVMLGYLKQEEATNETIENGWLRTGDMARFDRDGYVYIVGRKKEMINVRGLNVYPREIEEALYQNTKVKEAAVIGIPDPHKGEVPKAFIVLKEKEAATEREILNGLKERLAGFKIPKYVEFREFLPKNTTGKILKRVLTDEETRKNR